MTTTSPSKSQAIQTALLGDWQNATSINKTILKITPNDIETLNRLAFALTILGKIKRAKAIYRKVLKIDALNPIALRNIKRLAKHSSFKISKGGLPIYVNSAFLEENGKTKIVQLVNIAPQSIIARLTTGQPLTISIKRSKIFIQDYTKQYIGMLPDDIGKRLIRFIKGGNIYEAYVKAIGEHDVTVFLKETKRSSRFKFQPSFSQKESKSLNLPKNRLAEEE